MRKKLYLCLLLALLIVVVTTQTAMASPTPVVQNPEEALQQDAKA